MTPLDKRIVYFLECDNFVKIGSSSNRPDRNVQDRIAELQVGSPHQHKLIGFVSDIPDAPMVGEKILQDFFYSYRVRGEWFLYNKYVSTGINQILTMDDLERWLEENKKQIYANIHAKMMDNLVNKAIFG